MNRCIETLGAITVLPKEKAATISEQETDSENNDQMIYDLRQGVLSAMADDLKVSGVISCLLSGVKEINRRINLDQITPLFAKQLLNSFKEVDAILKIFDFNEKMEYSNTARALMDERDEARRKNDWALADRIRGELVTMGVYVHDKKV
jgi:cysteinyl-tRNA synthetase